LYGKSGIRHQKVERTQETHQRYEELTMRVNDELKSSFTCAQVKEKLKTLIMQYKKIRDRVAMTGAGGESETEEDWYVLMTEALVETGITDPRPMMQSTQPLQFPRPSSVPSLSSSTSSSSSSSSSSSVCCCVGQSP
jgi:hypothetical protein